MPPVALRDAVLVVVLFSGMCVGVWPPVPQKEGHTKWDGGLRSSNGASCASQGLSLRASSETAGRQLTVGGTSSSIPVWISCCRRPSRAELETPKASKPG